MKRRLTVLFGAVLVIASCARVQVDPIHITVDITIKIDRAIDEFFGAPPPAAATSATPAASAPR
jgi:hypothetical protein